MSLFATRVPELTAAERFWLTLWMWRYELERQGFKRPEARSLAHLAVIYRYSPAEIC